MSSSLIAMAPGRKHSRLRLPSTCDHINTSPSLSHTTKSTNFMDRIHNDNGDNVSIDEDENTNVEEKNNNRMPAAYLSKMLDSKDFLTEVDGSPSPAFLDCDPNNFMFPSQKPTATPLSKPGTLKMSSSQKKNRPSVVRHKPVEMFRKDLISAMKIPDNIQLSEKYWIMQDPWKIEWEKGVQVPVNPKATYSSTVNVIPKATTGDFRMPRKMLKSSPDAGDKDVIDFNVLADNTCRYDLDELDVCWLKENNEERKLMGLQPLDEFSMEQIMEELETQWHDNLQKAIQNKEGFGIEYDEDVVCDVCRLPDCEEGNEMVFCDGCNLCVHQACYGILKVPEGGWLCRPCSLGIQGSTQCILCNKKGGAMKSTRSGNKWAHVSCALWIPEISIVDPERMEPIAKVSHIPASRWSLCCNICKERVGACIQCSVKHCVVAYHVTCAIDSKLDMIADYGDIANGMDDAVIFRSYCKKHSKNKKEVDSENEEKREEIKKSLKYKRIIEMNEDFSNLVKCEDVASVLSVPVATTQEVTEYWKLKRRSQFDRPLITPKHEEGSALANAAETNLQKRLRMFTHLRQDLERVRNLCYMIGKREKTKKLTVKNMESVFLTQMKVLERQMADNPLFDSSKMIKTLSKFGQPEVCKLARKESILLAKSPEWSEQQSEKVTPKTAQEISDDEKIKPKKSNNISATNKEAESKKDLAKKTIANSDKKNSRSLAPKLAKLPTNTPKTLANKLKHTKSLANKLNSPSRKRTLPSNSSSDVESENQVPTPEIPPKTRRNKTQKWSSWNATGATASPSAFQIKSEKPLTTDESKNILSKPFAIKKSTVRLTRASGLFIEQKTNSLGTNVGNNRSDKHWRTTTRSDLDESGGNYGSSGVNTPDNDSRTLRSKNQSKIVDKSKRKEKADCTSNGHLSNESHGSTSCSSFTRSKSNGFAVSDGTVLTPRRRPATREAVQKAKNGPGAPARSCDSGRSNAEMEVGPLSAQELRKKAKSTLFQPRRQRKLRKSQSRTRPRSEDTLSSGEEEEDRGYRGDMDETESESPLASAVSHRKVFHSAPQTRTKTKQYTDSGDTTDSNSKTTSKSRRRFRNIQNRRRKDSASIMFKGFRDIIDSSKSHCSSVENRGTARSPLIAKAVPKNEPAVGDVSVEPNITSKDEYFGIAGGLQTSTVSQLSASGHFTQEPTNFDRDFTLPGTSFHPAPNLTAYNPGLPNTFPKATHVPDHNMQYNTQPPPSLNQPEMAGIDLSQQFNADANFPPMLNQILPSNLTHEQKTVYMQHLSHYLFGKSLGVFAPQTSPFEQFQGPQLPTLNPQVEPPNIPNVSVQSQETDNPPNKISPPPTPLITGASGSIVAPVESEKMTRDERVNVIQPHSDASSKISKKKSKKSKKKKKKKKRKLSQDSDKPVNCESSFEEYCIEYCSTLDPQQAEEESQNSNNPAADEFVSSTVNPDNKLLVSPSIKSEKLLLKIDRSRIVDVTSSNVANHEEKVETSTPDQSRPFVSPLKLKLCGQKSDRTLRNGLKPCEYQILEGEEGEDKADTEIVEAKPKTRQPSPVVGKALSKPAQGEVRKRGRPRKVREETKTLPAPNPPPGNNPNSDPHKPLPEEQTSPHQPECHWKKRKVREHETSVTVDLKSDDSETMTQRKSFTAMTISESALIETSDNKIRLPQGGPVNTETGSKDMVKKELMQPAKTTSVTKLNVCNSTSPNGNTALKDSLPPVKGLFNKTKFLKESKFSLQTQTIKTESIDPYEFGDFGS